MASRNYSGAGASEFRPFGPSTFGATQKSGQPGFYWGGPGTGYQAQQRLQPGNRRGSRNQGSYNIPGGIKAGLFILDLYDVLAKIEQFKKTNKINMKANTSAIAANLRAAKKLQALMVEQRRKGAVQSRRGVSTHRLDEALLDDRNRFVTGSEFGVGIPVHLNATAPYWRAIEQGTSYFVGRYISGIWGESLTGDYGSGKYGKYPLAGPRYTGFGANRAGRLLPPGGMGQLGVTRSMARGARRRVGGVLPASSKRRADFRGQIQRPIVAQKYMRKAWIAFDAKRTIVEVAREQVKLLKGAYGIP